MPVLCAPTIKNGVGVLVVPMILVDYRVAQRITLSASIVLSGDWKRLAR